MSKRIGTWNAMGLLAMALGALLLLIGWRSVSMGFLILGLVATSGGLGMFLWGPPHPALQGRELRCRTCSEELPRKAMGGKCPRCGEEWQIRSAM